MRLLLAGIKEDDEASEPFSDEQMVSLTTVSHLWSLAIMTTLTYLFVLVYTSSFEATRIHVPLGVHEGGAFIVSQSFPSLQLSHRVAVGQSTLEWLAEDYETILETMEGLHEHVKSLTSLPDEAEFVDRDPLTSSQAPFASG